MRSARPRLTVYKTTAIFTFNGFKTNFIHSKQLQQMYLVTYTHTTNLKATGQCLVCSGSHSLVNCKKCNNWSAVTHYKWVRYSKICFQCLRSGHWAQDCKSSAQCDKCPRRHHPETTPSVGPGVPLSVGVLVSSKDVVGIKNS